MIYLNAASHGLPAAAVRHRMIAYLQREEQIGAAAAEMEAAEEMAAVKAKAARVIGAPASNVTLVGTTTIGWNVAVQSLPLQGRRVLVAPGEWASDVAVLERMGATIEIIPTDGQGGLNLPALARRLDRDVAAICAPMVCSLTGERYPLVEIGALPRPETTLFIVDAAQAVGQVPVCVTDLNCDILAATTRKWLRGPRDTAMLYVSENGFAQMGPNPAPRIYGISGGQGRFDDADGIRRFDPNSAFAPQRLGLGVALDLFLEDPAKAMAVPNRLAEHARALAREAGMALACPDAARASAIVTLRLPADLHAATMEQLHAADIAVAAPPPGCEPLRAPETVTGGFLRISAHAYNTEDQIAQVFDILGAAAGVRRV